MSGRPHWAEKKTRPRPAVAKPAYPNQKTVIVASRDFYGGSAAALARLKKLQPDREQTVLLRRALQRRLKKHFQEV